MPIFARENGQNTRILKGRHFVCYENGRRRLLAAQSINNERASLHLGTKTFTKVNEMEFTNHRAVFFFSRDFVQPPRTET